MKGLGLHAEMPHDFDFKPTKKCKNCWWIMLLIAGFFATLCAILLIINPTT